MPYADPAKARAKNRETYYKRHEYYKAQKAQWAREHPEYAQKQALKRRYGMTPDDVKALLESQGGVCALCQKALEWPAEKRTTHVDHCHDTGRVRGILCNKCNTSIGAGRDKPEFIKRLIAYLGLEGF